MNSSFAREQARHLAQRAGVEDLKDPAAGIQRLHRICYGRAAEPEEVALGLEYLRAAGERRASPDLSAWENYVQVLLMGNEFVFVD